MEKLNIPDLSLEDLDISFATPEDINLIAEFDY